VVISLINAQLFRLLVLLGSQQRIGILQLLLLGRKLRFPARSRFVLLRVFSIGFPLTGFSTKPLELQLKGFALYASIVFIWSFVIGRCLLGACSFGSLRLWRKKRK
jgi:hypothetical protein